MAKSLSKLPSPVLVGVVKEKTIRASLAEIQNAMYDGAGMIDLHMSCLEKTDTDTLREIMSASKLPVLALNYNVDYDGNLCGYTEEERVAMFLRAIDAGAAGIDMQGYTFDANSKANFQGEDKYSFTKNNPREIVTDESVISKQCELIEKVHSKGAEVLLSCHPGIPMKAEQVTELALFLEKRNPDIIKIVTMAENEEDLAESFKAMLMLKNNVKTPVSYHAGGKSGTLSRIINPILGGHMVFCVDRFNESSLLEQLDLKTSKTVVENIKKFL